MTHKEVLRFIKLKKELFGDSMFVVPDTSNPKWAEYNKLSLKFSELAKEIKSEAKKQYLRIV